MIRKDIMFENPENSGFTLRLKRIAFLLILSLCISVAGAKDVPLSELPEAVRVTIEREAKGFEIDDIDRENDDGKIVYGVKAESQDGRRNEMVVAEDGSLIKKDEQLRGEDLPGPIAEAVRQSVGDVVFFRIRRTVSVGGEVKYDIEADTEESEIVLQIAGDGSIINKDVKAIDRNSIERHGALCPARRHLIKLRYQLKLAAFGDSRGKKGINPMYFF
ncbi:MAG: PepSY domain-containing protein, partial [Planctomycetota bacterium]